MAKAKVKTTAKAVKPSKVTKKKARTKKKVEPTKNTSESRPKKVSDSGKVFDVARPGSSMPSASARPVIVTGRPLANDPMVKTEDDGPMDNSADEVSPMAARAKKVVIQPLSDNIVADDDVISEQLDEQPGAEMTAKDEADTTSTLDASVDSGSESEQSTEPIEKQPEADDSEEISELASQAAAKGEAAKEAERAAQRAAEAEKIIDSKKYFVPINTVKKRRAIRIFWVVAVLVLVAAGVAAAIDAELLDIGIELPFDYL